MQFSEYKKQAKAIGWYSAIVVFIILAVYLSIVFGLLAFLRTISLPAATESSLFFLAVIMGPFVSMIPAYIVYRIIFPKAPCPSCGQDLHHRVARGTIIGSGVRQCPFCECDPFDQPETERETAPDEPDN